MIQGAALDKRDGGAVLVALSSTLRGETEGALAMDEDEVKEGCVRTPLNYRKNITEKCQITRFEAILPGRQEKS